MSCTCKKHDDYDLGTTVRIRASLTTEGGAADAQNVTLKIRRPDNTESTLSVSHPGLGEYFRDVIANQSGQWRFQWTSDVPGAVEEGSFIVRRSAFV